jgi:hypothetical protein
MSLHDPSRRDYPGGLHHVPNLAGVGKVCVHVLGETLALDGFAILGGLAYPLLGLPFATLDAAP